MFDKDDEVTDCELMPSDDGSNGDNTKKIGDLENNSEVREIHAPEAPRK